MTELLNQLVLTRDARIGKVTNLSDGWLILDDDTDNAVLPDEVKVVDPLWPNSTLENVAIQLNLDPLQIAAIPDKVRRAANADSHAYKALQCIPHPTVSGAYMTIKAVNNGKYLCLVKPAKGSSFNMSLTEDQVSRFENDGILPIEPKPDPRVQELEDQLKDLNEKLALTEQALLDALANKKDPVPQPEAQSKLQRATKTVIQVMRHDRPETIRNADAEKDSLEAEGHVLMSEFVDTVVQEGRVVTVRTLRFEYETSVDPAPDDEENVEVEADDDPQPPEAIVIEEKPDLLEGLPIATALREHGLPAVTTAMNAQVALSLHRYRDDMHAHADQPKLTPPNLRLEDLS